MLGRKSFLLFLSRIIAALLGYVGLYFLTNYYPDYVYGELLWTLSFVAVFNAVSDLGFSSAHTKRISEGKDLNDCVSTYAVIKLVLTGAMVVLTLLSVFVWTSVMGKTFEESSLDIILLFILYHVLFDISSIGSNTFAAKMEMAKLPLVTMADPFIRVPLVAIFAILSVDVLGLTIAYVISALGVALVATYLLLRDRIKWKRPTLLRSYYVFALPLMALSIISVVNTNMDKLLLGIFWSNSEVGLYGAPQVFLAVFAIVGTAVSTLTFPSFSRLHTAGNIGMIRTVTQQAERYIMMISLPITILIIMFPYEICLVLISKFTDSSSVIGIMAITNLLLMLNSVDSSQILAVDRPDISVRITLINFIVNLCAILILVPDSSFLGFGLGLSFVGAALAILIGRIVAYVLTRYVIWHLTGTKIDLRLAYQFVAGLAVVLVLLWLPDVFTITRWYTLIPYGLISMGVYLGALALMKEFTRKDVDYFLDILNIKAMLGYIKGELKQK